jgi:hypothetical protein
MASDKDDRIEAHQEMSSEQISGAKIGFAIIAVLAICTILGIALPTLCPHTYERLKFIVAGVMED